MKKSIAIFLVTCVLFSLAGCEKIFGSTLFLSLIVAGDDSASKEDVFAFVCENEEALLTAIEAGNISVLENTGFLKYIKTSKTVVDFSCGGAGVGSGTSYVGFYYTPDNDMTAVWCAPPHPGSLISSGAGFLWQEPDGDNQYYTEHICGNFFYYEASF